MKHQREGLALAVFLLAVAEGFAFDQVEGKRPGIDRNLERLIYERVESLAGKQFE